VIDKEQHNKLLTRQDVVMLLRFHLYSNPGCKRSNIYECGI